MSAGSALHGDRSFHAGQSEDRCLQPLDELPTCGNDGHIEPLIDVARVLRDVIAIGVDAHRSVTIDASSKKIGKVFVGNHEWSQGQALRGRQADIEQPAIKCTIAPLKRMDSAAATVRCERDPIR